MSEKKSPPSPSVPPVLGDSPGIDSDQQKREASGGQKERRLTHAAASGPPVQRDDDGVMARNRKMSQKTQNSKTEKDKEIKAGAMMGIAMAPHCEEDANDDAHKHANRVVTSSRISNQVRVEMFFCRPFLLIFLKCIWQYFRKGVVFVEDRI